MANTDEQAPRQRAYKLFASALKEREIGKTKGYELVGDGLIETFKIGRRTYVYLDSLDALPAKLAAASKAGAQ